MEALAEGLWGLADHHEKLGEIAKAVKCLEAICQSDVSFYPIIEVKTRLRIATILLHHSHNVDHAKSHLQRCQLLLKSTQSCFELKCKVYSLLSQCYHLVGDIKYQKKVLFEGLQLAATSAGNNEVRGHHQDMEMEKANYDREMESLREQLESELETLAQKEQEVADINIRIPEIRDRLSELEQLMSSGLVDDQTTLPIKSKIDQLL